jgi:hypothetical protein
MNRSQEKNAATHQYKKAFKNPIEKPLPKQPAQRHEKKEKTPISSKKKKFFSIYVAMYRNIKREKGAADRSPRPENSTVGFINRSTR